MKNFVAIAILLGLLASIVFNNSALALTNTERYNTGYSWGCSDAKK